MKRIALIAFLISASAALFAQTADFKAMLKAVDEMGDFGKQDYSAVYSIVTEKPGENPSATEIQIYRRDVQDQFVILVNKPEKQKGQGYLKIDDNVWFYDPESGNFSHSTIKENIQNSEAKNSDFKKYTFSDDYEIAATASGKLGTYETWVLDLKAKTNEVSYQHVRLTIRKDKSVPLKEQDFSVSERLMRTVLYLPKYVEAGGKLIPSQIIMNDELNKGEKSVLTISDVRVGKLSDTTFSKAFLARAQ
jgi:outer membrane lipoprotein-sorting protein